MEILGLIFLWFEMHAVAEASDLPLLMKYLDNCFHSPLLPCPMEHICSLGEGLRTTLGSASHRFVMKLANLPILIN